ncbi:MAG: hypothetical protein GX175_09285 [Halanaerobiaceae bacterium]|nr:hypothetical protein [Halanaerobiaceae bacterium]
MKRAFFIVIIMIFPVFYISVYSNRVIVVSYIDIEEPAYTGETASLELLTYNIHHGVGLDGRLNLDRIARVIDKSGADIIGLNEVDMRRRRSGFKNQTAYLAKKLNMNYAYGPGKNGFPGSYGNAILTRYPIISTENIALPQSNRDTKESRSLLKVEIEIRDKRSIYILLTHLSLDRIEREEQFSWINNYIKNLNKPCILMGDFNAGIYELQTYLGNDEKGLRPLLSGVKTYPASNPVSGIDLFFSNYQMEVLDGYAIRTNASDHLPLYLKLRIFT